MGAHMTIDAAIQTYFSGFGLVAYPETSVPDDVVFPYLTYNFPLSDWDSGKATGTVNLYYYSTKNTEINAKKREIFERLGCGGETVDCDNGCVWFTRGTPFAQTLRDDVSPDIKRIYILIDAEYLITL